MKKSLALLFIAFAFQNCETPKSVATTPVASTAPKTVLADADRWQQRVEYSMNVDFDHVKHQYSGSQKIVYTNNSPDALDKAFFHLYNNAFQPGSIMDVRSRNIADADPRVADRIFNLKPDETGKMTVKTLTINGKPCTFQHNGTILEVILPEKINPLSTATFELTYEAQVPVQVRRNGRMSREGVDYSMAQWYPKLCEYDYQGWHANPYVGREFYGIWGDFDVKISIDQKYTLGGTGILQNAKEIGKGYAQNATPKPVNGKLTWHFKAQNVHDFMWGADPDYKHVTEKADDGTMLHFFYIPSEKTESWQQLPKIMAKSFSFIRDNYGKYPYSDFAFVQGGDGGMEYPMSTLITGERPLVSLVGVAVHELMHSWYQGVLGSNESLYSWMDEGFTSFASNYVMKHLGFVKKDESGDPMTGDVQGYARFAMGGQEEPLSMHSDHFVTNTAFSVGSYVKGATFLQQLKYIVGEETFKKALLNYFETWKFKHPNANDVIRIFEKQSGLELDWFKEYFVYTTHTIDYGVESITDVAGKSTVTLKKIGVMPMPLDVVVTYKNGEKQTFHIPLDIQRGEKKDEKKTAKYYVSTDWQWTNPAYDLTIPAPKKDIAKVEIDPSLRMADVNRDNNVLANE